MDPSLGEIEAVLAVARRGSFRAGAIERGVSATALSHQVARLEGAMGVRLFNRTTRSVALTEAGRVFVERVGPALGELRDGLEGVQAQGGVPSGVIRINAALSGARELLSPLVLGFLARHPAMQVDLVTEGRLVDIVADGFDLGVRVATLVPRDMIAVPLGHKQRHVAVAAPAYLAAHPAPASPAELHAHACIRVRLPDRSLYRWRFERDGGVVMVDVPGRLTLDEGSLVRQAAVAGAGIAYLFEGEVRRDLADGRLVAVLPDWTPELPGLCLYYPSRRHLSAGLNAFLAMAREQARSGAAGAVAL
ncbi:MAG: LysR substrate-binding domain-containing protein [Pseudomonadota bacterium]